MATEVILPKLGQTMEEGAIVEWFKKEGDPVKRGEVLFTVESDKAVLEVEATARGFLRKILVPEGKTVPVLTPVALITRKADEDIPEYEAGRRPEAIVPERAAPVEAADALLTPMGGINESGPVQDIDIGLDNVITAVEKSKTSNTDEKDEPDMEEIITNKVEPEALNTSEETPQESKGKSDQEDAAEPVSKGGGGFMDNLFEEEEEEVESPNESLISSLPDIPLEEVLTAMEEVKGLMHKWQSNSK